MEELGELIFGREKMRSDEPCMLNWLGLRDMKKLCFREITANESYFSWLNVSK